MANRPKDWCEGVRSEGSLRSLQPFNRFSQGRGTAGFGIRLAKPKICAMNRKYFGPRVWAGLTLACGTILAWPFLRQTNELSQEVTSGWPWSASATTPPHGGASAATPPGSDSVPSTGWPLASAGSEPGVYPPAWANKRTHLDELISGEKPTATFEALEIPADALLPELQAWRNELQATHRLATQPSSTGPAYATHLTPPSFGDTAFGFGDTASWFRGHSHVATGKACFGSGFTGWSDWRTVEEPRQSSCGPRQDSPLWQGRTTQGDACAKRRGCVPERSRGCVPRRGCVPKAGAAIRVSAGMETVA